MKIIHTNVKIFDSFAVKIKLRRSKLNFIQIYQKLSTPTDPQTPGTLFSVIDVYNSVSPGT